MSLLSRMSAPVATHALAEVVAALLSEPRHPTGARVGLVPTGLGTSAARIAAPAGPVPELHCPPALRDDPALGEQVNDRLLAWAEQIGIYPGRLDQLRAANFGRLLMLTHPDTDDPDRLLAAAKCALAEWAVDDHYCDDESAGADTELLGPRLAIATAAVDPAHLPARYTPELERARCWRRSGPPSTTSPGTRPGRRWPGSGTRSPPCSWGSERRRAGGPPAGCRRSGST